METSILVTIKKMLGLEADYPPYDVQITVLINSALMILQQYGIGPKNGFILTSADQTWDEFFAENDGKMLEAAKNYIYLQVKMGFDPPQTSFVMESYKQQCEELLWRLREHNESYPADLPRGEDEDTETELESLGGGDD